MAESASTIDRQLINAMRKGDATCVSTLRMLKSAVKNAEIEARHALSKQEFQKVVAREVKKRKEAAVQYAHAGDATREGQELKESDILSVFLPEQMSEKEVRAIVKGVVAKTGASSPKEMGKVMGPVMAKVAGKADGSLVKKIVLDVLK
ncbi:MAG: GatB/YqeY domain-containing protein [Candidatus Kerfeldbacteria bacterium]|nr:GatB/YqeY domain-containing protein [Candidatus Kerfeldbacteria bacterium]